MKIFGVWIISILIALFFGVVTGLTQTPELRKNIRFSFDGIADFSQFFAMGSDTLFYPAGMQATNAVDGYRHQGLVAAVSEGGERKWVHYDTTQYSWGASALSLQDKNLVVWSSTSGLLMGLDLAGNELWRMNLGNYAQLARYGDSIVAVEAYRNVRAVIMDLSGNITREFPITSSSNYISSIHVSKDSLWIFSGDANGVEWNTAAFVKKMRPANRRSFVDSPCSRS